MSLQFPQASSFLLLFGTVLEDTALQPNQLDVLRLDLVVQLVESVHQSFVSKRQQVQVLVPRNELSNRLRREQDLGRIERTSFVDLDQSSL